MSDQILVGQCKVFSHHLKYSSLEYKFLNEETVITSLNQPDLEKYDMKINILCLV